LASSNTDADPPEPREVEWMTFLPLHVCPLAHAITAGNQSSRAMRCSSCCKQHLEVPFHGSKTAPVLLARPEIEQTLQMQCRCVAFVAIEAVIGETFVHGIAIRVARRLRQNRGCRNGGNFGIAPYDILS